MLLDFNTLTLLTALFPQPSIVPLLLYQVFRHSLAANSMLETDHISFLQIGTTHAAIG